MRSSPPPPPAALKGKPPKIEFPEDKYVDRYYKRHPNARFDPVDLISDMPHYVQSYARWQWELIEDGLSEEEARDLLDKHIAEAQRRIEKASSKGKDEEDFDEEDVELASMIPSERTRQFIEAVQMEEEEVLARMAHFRALKAEAEAEEQAEFEEYEEDGEEYEEGEEEEEEEGEAEDERRPST